MSVNPKIFPTHLNRMAVVYLRQSSLRQVRENRESTDRQYRLEGRVRSLGWSAERIELVDEDLGTSGTSTVGRGGFQKLAEDVADGRVGAIVALEVSRLARSSADWHRLLELCGLADVVILDEDAVYSPTDYNDRLLLGLKGQMSEAELYWMKLRLQGGKLNKARRGELARRAPIGYQWDVVSERLELDENREVRDAVGLVFTRFRVEGSAYGVARYFASHGLRLPARAVGSTEVRWVPPKPEAILRMLHNPAYAGTYVFGRRRHRHVLLDGEPRRRSTQVPRQQWSVCIQGRHAGYLTWEEFLENQKHLRDNSPQSTSEQGHGAPREGRALLQGLVLCGKCGDRMASRPQRGEHWPLYSCRSPLMRRGERGSCWSVSSRSIDEAVVALVLDAVCPEEIELSLAVLAEAEKQACELRQQWKLRLDSAAYEARLAERRYKAVDPDNRVVAYTLERTWEEKLRNIQELEREYQTVLRRRKLELDTHDRRRILELSRELPRVFWAETTTAQQRKTLLRLLVRQVTLSPVETPVRSTRIQMLWHTGAVSDLTIARPAPGLARCTPGEAVERLRELYATSRSDSELAAVLNREGYRTASKRPWTRVRVRSLRARLGIRRGEPGRHDVRRADRRSDGLYSAHGVATRFGVSECTVNRWRRSGLLEAAVGGDYRSQALWYRLDEAAVERIEKYLIDSKRQMSERMHKARDILEASCRRDELGRWRSPTGRGEE